MVARKLSRIRLYKLRIVSSTSPYRGTYYILEYKANSFQETWGVLQRDSDRAVLELKAANIIMGIDDNFFLGD